MERAHNNGMLIFYGPRINRSMLSGRPTATVPTVAINTTSSESLPVLSTADRLHSALRSQKAEKLSLRNNVTPNHGSVASLWNSKTIIVLNPSPPQPVLVSVKLFSHPRPHYSAVYGLRHPFARSKSTTQFYLNGRLKEWKVIRLRTLIKITPFKMRRGGKLRIL